MTLTKDQLKKLCEGFDAMATLRENAHNTTLDLMRLCFSIGRQHQAKMDAALCKRVSMDFDEPRFVQIARAARYCADAIELSIEVKR